MEKILKPDEDEHPTGEDVTDHAYGRLMTEFDDKLRRGKLCCARDVLMGLQVRKEHSRYNIYRDCYQRLSRIQLV